MTDRRGDGRLTGRPLPNVAGEHRLNDVNCGHLGRLTYVPVDAGEEQTGRLHTTRSIDLSPHFRQITPFKRLARPTRNVLPESQLRSWRAVRSQRNWLLKSHPEALLGGPDLGRVLSEEIRGLKTAGTSPSISSLLALGEISDLRHDTQVVGQPAVAFAAGEGGHILQISTLAPDERGWGDEELVVRLNTAQSNERGQWIEDGVPISVVKFAVDPQRYDPVRWVLVQKATSTTVLEPEIRKTPVKGNLQGSIDLPGAFQISANPLFTIRTDETGGGVQSDVSFNPASAGAPPQLAIINTAGYWSIWDVTGDRARRPKHLRPVLKVCGNIVSGLIPAPPLVSREYQTIHRVSWISRSKEASSGVSSQGQGYFERQPKLLPRSDHILLCNDTSVRVFSITDSKSQTGLSVARPSKAERVLDVRTCPFDHSKAFVLTTTTLFWVSNEPAPADGIRLAVIISSPHYKKPNDGTLRLGVSPRTDFSHTAACFVCVYSSTDDLASVFWFTEPTAGGPSQFSCRTVSLDGPAGLNSMAIFLLPSLRAQGKVISNDAGSSALHHARFFQLFVLGPDMGLRSSLVAWSPFPFRDVRPAGTGSKSAEPGSRRKELIRHLGEAFVVPDDFGDHNTRPGEFSRHSATPELGNRKVKGRTTTDFTLLSDQLRQIYRDQVSRESAAAQPPVTPLPAIRAVVEESIAGGHPSFHLLSEMAEMRLDRADADKLQDIREACRDEVLDPRNERTSVIERSAYAFHPDSQSLSESIKSQALLPDNASEESRQRQQDIVHHAMAEAYMSLLGISVAPHSVEPSLDAGDIKSEGDLSRPMSPMFEQDLPGSPTDSFSPRSGQRGTSSLGFDGAEGADGDPVVARLRMYLPTAAGVKPRKGHQSRLLSHWPEQPGSDVKDYSWEAEASGPDQEIQRQRKRREEARRRRFESRLPSLRPERVGESSTQPVPRTAGVFSSQSQVPYSSQGQGSTSLFASQPMSQVIPGPHGGRPPQLKKKKKSKGGRRRGFR